MSMNPTTPPLELEPSELPKRPKIGLVVGALLLIAGGAAAALIVADRRAEAKKKEAVATAFGRLQACLVGTTPLDASEKPSARVRVLQLAVAEQDPAHEADPTREIWPFSCQQHAYALTRLMEQEHLSKPGAQDLAAAAKELGDKLPSGNLEARLADLSAPVDQLFAKAKEQGVSAIVPADAKAGPAAKRPLLSLDDLAKAKPLAAHALAPHALEFEVHRGRGLTFVVSDPTTPGGPRVCSVNETGTRASCKKVAPAVAAVSGDARLLSARDPSVEPLISFGNASSFGAFASDTGARVIEGEKFGWALRRKDGHAVTLTYKAEDKALRLSLDGKGGAPLKLPGKVANENLYYAAGLVPGFVLLRGANDEGELRLFALPLQDDATTGAPIEVGPVDGWWAQGTAPQFRSCTSDALAVAVRDKMGFHVTIAETRPASGGSASQKDGTWTVPAEAGALEKADFTCHGAEATFTSADAEYVSQWRCAHGICDHATATLPQLKDEKRFAVDVDGTVAMIVRPSDRGGFQLHLAPIDGLAKSNAVPLFDDRTEGGALVDKPWVQDVTLQSLGGAALAVVATPKGTWLVRIAKDGTAAPISVEG